MAKNKIEHLPSEVHLHKKKYSFVKATCWLADANVGFWFHEEIKFSFIKNSYKKAWSQLGGFSPAESIYRLWQCMLKREHSERYPR